jgi:7-carboxy-7-deazaguanine synthase
MYFVRLQGCDVGCYFCDTKYTWRDKSPDVQEQDIVKRAVESQAHWMCITGGEPYEQDLTKLVALAHDDGLKVQVETSGAAKWQDMFYPPIDWICLSPKDLFTKKEFRTKMEFKQWSHEIKCVVTKPSDIDYYIDNYYDFCRHDKPLIFQLVDNNVKLVKNILDTIHERNLSHARCMMQIHKIMELR